MHQGVRMKLLAKQSSAPLPLPMSGHLEATLRLQQGLGSMNTCENNFRMLSAFQVCLGFDYVETPPPAQAARILSIGLAKASQSLLSAFV